MPLDFNQIAVPFRMQPGLARMAQGATHLTPLVPGSALHAEKLAVMQAGASRLQVPGFNPAPALAAIAAQARIEGADGPLAAGAPLELAFEEDFAVLDGRDGCLPWLCVCTPSHWAPEDKLGLPFAAVHAQVADNQALLAAASHLVRLVTGGEHWERQVWTISPSGRHDQHPRRHAREPWPRLDQADDPAGFASACWLRSERQTFLPVPSSQQAVFTIRVEVEPLVRAVDQAWQARRLLDSLASMSPAVLDYKGLAQARGPLMRWLQARSGH